MDDRYVLYIDKYRYRSKVLSVIYTCACGWIWLSWCLVMFQKTATCHEKKNVSVEVVKKTSFISFIMFQDKMTVQNPNIPLFMGWLMFHISSLSGHCFFEAPEAPLWCSKNHGTVLMYAETNVSKVKLSKRTWHGKRKVRCLAATPRKPTYPYIRWKLMVGRGFNFL